MNVRTHVSLSRTGVASLPVKPPNPYGRKKKSRVGGNRVQKNTSILGTGIIGCKRTTYFIYFRFFFLPCHKGTPRRRRRVPLFLITWWLLPPVQNPIFTYQTLRRCYSRYPVLSWHSNREHEELQFQCWLQEPLCLRGNKKREPKGGGRG